MISKNRRAVECRVAVDDIVILLPRRRLTLSSYPSALVFFREVYRALLMLGLEDLGGLEILKVLARERSGLLGVCYAGFTQAYLSMPENVQSLPQYRPPDYLLGALAGAIDRRSGWHFPSDGLSEAMRFAIEQAALYVGFELINPMPGDGIFLWATYNIVWNLTVPSQAFWDD